MADLLFTSSLGGEHKGELERLLFFNENQAKVVEGVAHIAHHYGIPRVQRRGDRLRIVLGGDNVLQSLYAIDKLGAPIGVVAYTREHDTLVVLFVAIDEHHASGGPGSGRMVLVKLLRELQAIARRVRGIARLEVYLGRREPTRIAITRQHALPESPEQ